MKELRCKQCNKLLAKIEKGSCIKEDIICNSCYVNLKILNNKEFSSNKNNCDMPDFMNDIFNKRKY